MSYNEGSAYRCHYSLWISEDMKEKLDRISVDESIPKTTFVREAIQFFIELHEKGQLIVQHGEPN